MHSLCSLQVLALEPGRIGSAFFLCCLECKESCAKCLMFCFGNLQQGYALECRRWLICVLCGDQRIRTAQKLRLSLLLYNHILSFRHLFTMVMVHVLTTFRQQEEMWWEKVDGGKHTRREKTKERLNQQTGISQNDPESLEQGAGEDDTQGACCWYWRCFSITCLTQSRFKVVNPNINIKTLDVGISSFSLLWGGKKNPHWTPKKKKKRERECEGLGKHRWLEKSK